MASGRLRLEPGGAMAGARHRPFALWLGLRLELTPPLARCPAACSFAWRRTTPSDFGILLRSWQLTHCTGFENPRPEKETTYDRGC